MQNKDLNSKRGQTITFYSYKGGVGRTMALVNIACLLAKEGRRVLLIDCDLEAPGLHHFFNTSEDISGFVDFITSADEWISVDANNNEEGYWQFTKNSVDTYIEKSVRPKYNVTDISVDLMKAGKFDQYYTTKLNSINWLEIYKKAPAFFRTFASNLEEVYDYVFVDARTGLADTSGICTMLLPQKLILVFGLNHQNISGIVNVASQAIDYRLSSNDHRSLNIYPLPSRVENSVTPNLQEWIDNYKSKFEALFTDKYLLEECDLSAYFSRCFIQYYPIHAYGENVPSLYEDVESSNFITSNYYSFLTVLKKDIPAWEVLRIQDERLVQLLYISCVSNELGNYRDALRKDFARPNVNIRIQEDFVALGDPTLEKIDDYIKTCDAVIHLCGDMAGVMADPASLDFIRKKYTDFADRLPLLREAVSGKIKLSYTQWEAYLAIYHSKLLFVASPATTAIRDNRFVRDSLQIELQRQHLARLKNLGYYDEIHFTSQDDLVKKLYRSNLGNIAGIVQPKSPSGQRQPIDIQNIPINLPYKSIGKAFKGRESFIAELRQTFNESNTIAGIAIYGLGGTGKTRLAVEYAWQYMNDYTALLFVNAYNPELLITNISRLYEQVLDLHELSFLREEEEYFAVIKWLNQHPGWLLILDGADTPEAAKKVEEVFAQLQDGHVLITTRLGRWSLQVKKKPLGILNHEDATAFLLETTNNEREKTKKDIELAGAIASDLGDLALALEQARAYIVTKEISFERYRKVWEKSMTDVLSWFDAQLMQYPGSIAITWQTSFNQLSDVAIKLLNRLAWLAAEPIPKTFLDVELPEGENIDAQSAWEELKQYSLTTVTEDKKAFTIHRLVLDVTLGKMNEVWQLQTLRETLRWMDAAFIGDPTNVTEWPYLEPLVPHVLRLANHALMRNINVPTSTLISKAAAIFLAKAQYAIAEPLMRSALEIDEKTFGPNHSTMARNLDHLAQLLQSTNRLQEAEPLMRKALEIDEQNLGPNHPFVARDLNSLVQLLLATGRLEEAQPLLRRALEIDEQNFGFNHPAVASSLSNFAQLLKDTNRLDEAEPLLRKALEIDEQSFGSNHPKIAIRLNNLAQLLHAKNRLEEAEPLMRRALEIDEQSFGTNHPDVARDLNNLAQLLKATARLQEAEPLLRRALEIDEQTFGVNHPTVAIRLNNLGLIMQATNRFAEAESLLKRALLIFNKSLTADHPYVEAVLANYILQLKAMGRTEEAITDMVSALFSKA